MIDLDAIATLAREAKARADRATPWPWLEDECCIFSDTGGLVPDDTPLFTVNYMVCSADESQRLTEIWREQHANADFIAASRTDVPALADAVLALVKQVRRLGFGPVMPEAPSEVVCGHVEDCLTHIFGDAYTSDVRRVWDTIRGALLMEQGRG